MKTKPMSTPKLLSAFVAIAALMMCASTVIAGEMTIEEGSVFSDSFTKDGRRVEVTKTYTRDGVVIQQKIYNEETGQLIREKTTTNPIKDHVRIVDPGTAGNVAPEQLPVDRVKQTDSVPAANKNLNQMVDKIESVEEEKADTDAADPSRAAQAQNEEDELEKNVGADVTAEKSRIRYGLSEVKRVLVGTNADRPEISLEGTRTSKLFGLIDIKLPVTIIVDAESGDLVEEETSLLGKLLGPISSK